MTIDSAMAALAAIIFIGPLLALGRRGASASAPTRGPGSAIATVDPGSIGH